MKKTATKSIYPLNKGLDRSSVPGMQDPASLRVAKNIAIKNKGLTKKAPGRVRIPYAGNSSGLQAAIHFFATSGGAQRSEIVRVINGRVEAIRDGVAYDLGLAVSPTDIVTFEKFGNVLIIHFENTRPYYYTIGSSSLTALGILSSHVSSPPGFSRAHDFRLWYGGRPADPHGLWVSAIDNLNQYSLLSGGFRLSVRSGDGDPIGLTGLSQTFRGDLYAFKLTSTYRIFRSSYGYGLSVLTDEVGSVHHNTIVSTQNDIFWVSSFGIHSLASTDKYGAAEEATISYPIFDYFQDRVNWSATKSMVATFDKSLNCYLLTYTSSASSVNDSVLGFNVITKEFFEWDNCEYPTIGRYFDFGRQRSFVGDNTRGLGVLLDDYNKNFDDPINLTMTTGVIFPTQNPTQVLSFTQIWLLAKPTSKSVTVSLKYWIDGLEIETLTFDTFGSGDGAIIGTDLGGIIGTDFIGKNKSDMIILGENLSGEGRSIQFEITQTPPDSDPDQSCEVYGIVYQFDYEEDQEKDTAI